MTVLGKHLPPRPRAEATASTASQDGRREGLARIAAVFAAGLGVVVFTVAPTAFNRWIEIAWLVLLLPLAVVVGRLWARGPRPGIRPLTIFAFAFIAVLGSRAIVLAAGGEGRYFEVDTATGATESVFTAQLARDEPEAGYTTETTPLVEVDAPSRTMDAEPLLSVGTGDARVGSRYLTLSGSAPAGARSVAVTLTGPTGSPVAVAEGDESAAAIAIRAREPLSAGSSVQLYVRYSAEDGSHLSDLPAADPVTETPNGWVFTGGYAETPEGAVAATPLLVIHTVPRGGSYTVDLDSPLLVAGERSADEFIPGTAAAADKADYLTRALAICIVLLSAIILGFSLPVGARLAARAPPLRLPGFDEPRTRFIAAGILIIGLLGYALEMRSYGGYGGYLDSLSELGVAGLGKWYLHALAALPTAAAVYVIARRIALRTWRGWAKLEIAIVVIGAVIAVSYFLKAAVAIPVLTLLLFAAFVRRRGWLPVAAAGAVLAVATPLIYLVRDRGKVEIGPLFTTEYWREFADTVSSRFFHFESAMIAVPSPASDKPWQPIADFFVTVVPRTFWEDKPLSASARFTQDHLLSSLSAGTDVGVISLPGELWLVGGTLGLLAGGLLIGVLLRVSDETVRREAAAGTALVAAALVAGLVFLNDGWGLASALTVMLITSAGWIVLLRRGRQATGAQ